MKLIDILNEAAEPYPIQKINEAIKALSAAHRQAPFSLTSSKEDRKIENELRTIRDRLIEMKTEVTWNFRK